MKDAKLRHQEAHSVFVQVELAKGVCAQSRKDRQPVARVQAAVPSKYAEETFKKSYFQSDASCENHKQTE
jgi:hypothetical protein